MRSCRSTPELRTRSFPFMSCVMVFFFAAIVVSGFVPAPTAAQGAGTGQVASAETDASAGCGWCWHWKAPWMTQPKHVFPRGNDSCGWPPPPPHYRCARCGSGHGCHTAALHGPCHILCGPAGGDLAQILDAARRGFEGDNATEVADALLAAPAGIQVEYLSDAGRIDFILQCAPEATAKTMPVPPGEIRDALEVELRTRRGERLVAVLPPLP